MTSLYGMRQKDIPQLVDRPVACGTPPLGLRRGTHIPLARFWQTELAYREAQDLGSPVVKATF